VASELPGSGTGVLRSRLSDPNRYLRLPRSEATLDAEWLLFTLLASDAKRACSSTLQQPGGPAANGCRCGANVVYLTHPSRSRRCRAPLWAGARTIMGSAEWKLWPAGSLAVWGYCRGLHGRLFSDCCQPLPTGYHSIQLFEISRWAEGRLPAIPGLSAAYRDEPIVRMTCGWPDDCWKG
jgi:hypothetical protein